MQMSCPCKNGNMKTHGKIARIAMACGIAFFASFVANPAFARGLVFVTVDCAAMPMSSIENLSSLPNIDGLALEIPWSRIEITQGKYAWSFLDTAIRNAAARKKYVTLYLTGSPRLPVWLSEGGKVQTFACGNLARGVFVDAVPWNKNYLYAYTRFLQAAALHFKAMNMTPYVFALGVVAPQRDCTIDGSLNGSLGTVAYNRAAYLLACKQMVDNYARIFPTTRLFLPTPHDQVICLPVHDRDFYSDLLTYALSKHGKNCWLFSRDLSSAGSHNTASYTQFAGRCGLAYQIPAANAQEQNPSNVNRAVNIGLSNGAIYLEINATAAMSGDSAILQALEQIHRQ